VGLGFHVLGQIPCKKRGGEVLRVGTAPTKAPKKEFYVRGCGLWAKLYVEGE